MTLNLMTYFGIHYHAEPNKIYIPSQGYHARDITIENDWSAASFFYMMAMMHTDAEILLQGLDEKSLQGDSYVKDLCVDFGIESFFDQSGCFIRKVRQVPADFNQPYSMNSYPDLAIPFMVACALCYPSVQITGIEHLEFKESKRITALQTELRKIGIELVYKNDVLTFSGTPMDTRQETVFFNTYHDHRIAMSLTLLAIFGFKIVLDDTQCVKKSFPNFFNQIAKLGFVVE
jgi:3-phosphoshikimate 1-carboxyvinyltransferase